VVRAVVVWAALAELQREDRGSLADHERRNLLAACSGDISKQLTGQYRIAANVKEVLFKVNG